MESFVIYAAFTGNDVEMTAGDPGKPDPVFAVDPLLEAALTAAAADLFPCVLVHDLVRQAPAVASITSARKDGFVFSGAVCCSILLVFVLVCFVRPPGNELQRDQSEGDKDQESYDGGDCFEKTHVFFLLLLNV